MSKALASIGLVTETLFDDGGHRVTQIYWVQNTFNRSTNASPSLSKYGSLSQEQCFPPREINP